MAAGGAALEPELAWKLEALGWQVAIGYGLTETAPLLTLNPPGKARIGSAGKPIPGVELRIDPSASPVKLATVFGASSSNSRAVNWPSLVVKCAYNIGMLSGVKSYRYRYLDVRSRLERAITQ